MPELTWFIVFLLNLLILGMVLGIIYYIATLIIGLIAPSPPIAAQATKIVAVICLLILLLWVVGYATGSAPIFYRYK